MRPTTRVLSAFATFANELSAITLSGCDLSSSGYRDILAELPEVANASKRLPVVSHKDVHHIVTTSLPIAVRFCQLGFAKSWRRRKQSSGIIQRSTSPGARTLYMVQENNGSWRHREDFRQLNMVTEPDAYPLDNMLDFAAKAGWVYSPDVSLMCM